MDQQDAEDNIKYFRTCVANTNVLSRSDGSVNYSQGDTTVLVGVHGPAETRISKQQSDKAIVEITLKRKTGHQTCADKFKENLIQRTCEAALLCVLHPRTSISVVIQILQDSGSLLACCVNAVCLALIDSGLPMKHLFTAIHCSIDDEGNINLDPSTTTQQQNNSTTEQQQQQQNSSITFVVDNINNDVIMVNSSGLINSDRYTACLNMCRNASHTMFKFYRDVVQQRMNQLTPN